LYVSYQRSGIRCREDAKEIGILQFAPDLVVEILSPSNSRSKIEKKLKDYCAIGVRECWIACNVEKTFEVLEPDRTGVRSRRKYEADEEIQSLVLPQLDLTVENVFA
jgi:Uma2 family endonuclease